MSYYKNVPCWIREIPRHLKIQEMCEEAVWIEPCSLAFVPDRFKAYVLMQLEVIHTHSVAHDNLKIQKICNQAMRENPAVFFLVSDHFKTKKNV